MTVIKIEGIPGRRFEAVPNGPCSQCAFYERSPNKGTLTEDQQIAGCIATKCIAPNLNIKEVGYDPSHRE